MATKPAATPQTKGLVQYALRIEPELRDELMQAAAEQSIARNQKVSVNQLINEFCRAGLVELAKHKRR